MKALITGGAGFIGQYVARELVARGWEVQALDVLSPQVHDSRDHALGAFPGVVHIRDVSESSAWEELTRCDLVVHLAAETGTAQSMYEAERYRRVNVDGTANAARAAARWGAHLIFFSSRAVYGEGPYTCQRHGNRTGSCCPEARSRDSRETDALSPVSVYGETKVEGESLLAAELPGIIPVDIVRPQNVIGPGQALHNPYTGVLAAFLSRLKEDKPLTVYGDGSATRDFIHVADVARFVGWLATTPPAPGQPRILNAGTGTRTTLTQLAEASAEGSPRGTASIAYVDIHRAGDIEHACADMTAYREAGAPEPQWSSHDAIVDFIRASWDTPGIASEAWDAALNELTDHGMTS